MARRAQENRKDQKKKKPAPPLDPLRQKDLERLAELNTMLSPFWSARSNYSH